MAEDKVNIEINGRAFEARKGAMIIQVADEAGFLIPRFCYHEKLSVAANCRMCLVEVEKAPKPMPACATPVMDGMKVFTKSKLALRAQKSVMEFLLINHPLDCPICDQGGECELQDVAMGYGRDVSRFNERKRVVADENLGSLISTDMTRCIHCTRCVRFGEEIAGLPELGVTGRGEDMRIETFVEKNMDSELSGNVIDVCPVGALTSKPFRFRARAWEVSQHASIGPHDAVGSHLYLHTKGAKVVRVVPKRNEAINEVWLADRDRFSYEGLYSEDRLGAPRIKRDGEWQDVDWDTALAAAAEGIESVLGREGPQSLGAIGSPSATLEELYLLQKLARGLGSHNVDHRLRQSDLSDEAQAPLAPWLGRSIASLERGGAALLVGSDCRRDQPLLNHRLRKLARSGGEVWAVNALDYEFNYPLAGRIVCAPNGIVAALAGIARALDAKPSDAAGKALAALVARARVEDSHRRIAESLGGAERPTLLLGGVALALPVAATVRALAGFIAREVDGVLGYLADGANAVGAHLAGATPHRGPGGKALPEPGLALTQMLEAGLKAYLVLGVEPEVDAYDSSLARSALANASHVVCLTAFRSPAMEAYADVLLPVSPFAENEGTLVNAEGSWQRFSAAVPPSGESRPAWKVLRVLGNRFELEGFDYLEASEVCEELRTLCPEQLPSTRDAWRVPESLPAPARNGLQRIGDVPIYAVDSLVRRAAALQRTTHAAGPRLSINRRLADELKVEPGARVRASQNGASVELELVVSDRVPDGAVHLSAGFPTAGLGPSFGPITLEKL